MGPGGRRADGCEFYLSKEPRRGMRANTANAPKFLSRIMHGHNPVALAGTKLPAAGIVGLSVRVYRRAHNPRRRSSQRLSRDATLSLSGVPSRLRMMRHLVLPLLTSKQIRAAPSRAEREAR